MRTEKEQKFALLWARSRTDAGKSQDYMAKALGVSKKTIQNWESGYSCPSQAEGFEWFDVLGLQPLPYYLSILYPEVDKLTTDGSKDRDEDIDAALIALIKDLPIETKRKILYVAYGDHGSSPLSVLEMIVAHLHVPLAGRLNIASNILTNYEIAQAAGTLVGGKHIMPNIPLLEHAFQKGKEAVKKGLKGYSSVE